MSGIKWGRVARPRTPITNAVLVASGPSVKDIDMSLLNKFKDTGAYIVAVNGAGAHVPFANAWFTLDPWGLNGPQIPPRPFRGSMYAAVPDDFSTPNARCRRHRTMPIDKITFLHRLRSHNYTSISSETAYKLGLSEDDSCINTGNSGYGALNFLYHIRPKNIYMLGIDATIGYFYSTTERNRPLTYISTLFQSAKPQLIAADINVVNVSPKSGVGCFPKITADDFHTIIRDTCG